MAWPVGQGGAHDFLALHNSSLGMCLTNGAGGDDWLIGKLFVIL